MGCELPTTKVVGFLCPYAPSIVILSDIIQKMDMIPLKLPIDLS
jgi:hypothetical protein